MIDLSANEFRSMQRGGPWAGHLSSFILSLPVPPIRLERRPTTIALLGHGEGIPVLHDLGKVIAIPESRVR